MWSQMDLLFLSLITDAMQHRLSVNWHRIMVRFRKIPTPVTFFTSQISEMNLGFCFENLTANTLR